MDDFIKFLGQDDRLCVVKWVRFDLDTMHSLASFNCISSLTLLPFKNKKIDFMHHGASLVKSLESNFVIWENKWQTSTTVRTSLSKRARSD
jgi:hypothetical protein